MIIVSDIAVNYLVLIGYEEVLPTLFRQIIMQLMPKITLIFTGFI